MHNPHLHLLIDDHEVLYRRNLTRFIERPQRVTRDPVLTPEKPWEGQAVSLWGSVCHDGEKFQMWYLGSSDLTGPLRSPVCYAISPDGFSWSRGDFDQYPWPGAERTNIVYRDEAEPEIQRTHPFTVLRDEIETDPDRRYKLVGYMNDAGGRGFTVGFSPDGVGWSYPGRVHLPRGDRTTVMQDFIRGGFVMASRGDDRSGDRDAGHSPRRDIAISRSDDLFEWTPGRRVINADDDDPPATEFYGMPMFVWGNQYIGLLEYYDPLNEVLNLQLATSRNCDDWERACSRQTYFDVGSSDSWDSTWVAFAFNPPYVRGDEMLFWYTGRPVAHRRPEPPGLVGAIGVARAPRDRFAGLRAGPDGGELTTDWVVIGGPRLLLNIGAANARSTVAVTGDGANPLEGFDHADCDLGIENGVDVEATWRGKNVASLVGRRVRLHIKITYATLYAYRFVQ